MRANSPTAGDGFCLVGARERADLSSEECAMLSDPRRSFGLLLFYLFCFVLVFFKCDGNVTNVDLVAHHPHVNNVDLIQL